MAQPKEGVYHALLTGQSFHLVDLSVSSFSGDGSGQPFASTPALNGSGLDGIVSHRVWLIAGCESCPAKNRHIRGARSLMPRRPLFGKASPRCASYDTK